MKNNTMGPHDTYQEDHNENIKTRYYHEDNRQIQYNDRVDTHRLLQMRCQLKRLSQRDCSENVKFNENYFSW